MAKWHRREQKGWKRRRPQDQLTQVITLTKDGRSAVGPKADHQVMQRYMDAHAFVPEGVEAWSEQQIRQVAAALVRDRPASWERTLIVLAHHQSRLACDLIKALWSEAPEELHGFCEQAYAEALMWIGETYEGDQPDDQAGEVLFEAEARGGRSS